MDTIKPKVKLEDYEAHRRISELPQNTPITVGEKRGVFLGMTGRRISIKLGAKNLHLPIGHELVREIKLS